MARRLSRPSGRNVQGSVTFGQIMDSSGHGREKYINAKTKVKGQPNNHDWSEDTGDLSRSKRLDQEQ